MAVRSDREGWGVVGRAALWVAVLSALGAPLISCGGGGGGGGGTGDSMPVAPNPTCSSNDLPASTTLPKQQIANGSPDVIVPSTSIEKPSDIGHRAHTNHLIARSPATRLLGVGGLYPGEIDGAYGAFLTGGSGAIAIVDAFSSPSVFNDFNVFSNQFSLPVETSSDPTSASNKVFQVVYANGSQPSQDGGWGQEISLDTQWAHATAPMAKIYLVEAASDNFADLFAAVRVAEALPNVKQVSMSFGGTETSCFFAEFDSALVKSGVTFFAAAGDDPGARDFPAESKNVVSVGGTTLTIGPGGTWVSEKAWNSTGCGVSHAEPRPSFQNSVFGQVGKYRGACDISANANTTPGVAVYDSFAFNGQSGWLVFGGTSASCAIIAGLVNNSGVAFRSSQALNAQLYSLIGTPGVHDVTSGASGGLSAGVGWDFPTGVGSPNGFAQALAATSSSRPAR